MIQRYYAPIEYVAPDNSFSTSFQAGNVSLAAQFQWPLELQHLYDVTSEQLLTQAKGVPLDLGPRYSEDWYTTLSTWQKLYPLPTNSSDYQEWRALFLMTPYPLAYKASREQVIVPEETPVNMDVWSNSFSHGLFEATYAQLVEPSLAAYEWVTELQSQLVWSLRVDGLATTLVVPVLNGANYWPSSGVRLSFTHAEPRITRENLAGTFVWLEVET